MGGDRLRGGGEIAVIVNERGEKRVRGGWRVGKNGKGMEEEQFTVREREKVRERVEAIRWFLLLLLFSLATFRRRVCKRSAYQTEKRQKEGDSSSLYKIELHERCIPFAG